MRPFRTIWPALLLSPLIGLAQTGPGGVGSSTNNILWLDANYHVTVAAGSVSGWSDRSGNGNNASQTVAAQRPVLTGSIFNGYPAVQFDNDQTNYDFLRVPDNSTLEGMNGLTGFVVYQLLTGTSANAPRCFFSKRDGVDTQEAYDWFLWNSGANVVQHLDINNTDHRASSSGNYVPGTTYLNGFTYHGSTPSDVNDQVLYDGNTAVGNRSEGATSIPNYTSDLYVGILRGHTGTGSNVSRFNGYISEIILYNSVLNDAQRIIVNNYLTAKYNIALASLDVYRQDDAAQGNYDHDVAGIGRISSTSTQTTSRGTGIVEVGGPTDLNDGEFLIWGHDNGSLGTFNVPDKPVGVDGRWQRTWRVSELNISTSAVDVGAVDITFDLSAFTSVVASDLRLLVDTDNDNTFADEIAIGGATSLGSGRYRFAGITAFANNRRFTLGTTNTAQTPLPVRLLSFSGECIGDHAQLFWSTASEENSDHFRVERTDDLVAWSSVGEIPAAGESTTTLQYRVDDPLPLTTTTYYRLAQVDEDASVVNSAVISLTPTLRTPPLLWPNPSNGRLNITSFDEDPLDVKVFDPQGRLVREYPVARQRQIGLDLFGLGVGCYTIGVRSASGTTYHTVVLGKGGE
ncbi:MAG: T9SS type A sorting domain-containing protein [Flavobacteriales bacterium]|nr:T9SS type A sorting domain-containing protein [Flavobacteriales bacterium]